MKPSAADERRVFEEAHRLYRAALIDPALDVHDLLWLQALALACFEDWMHALERELLATLPRPARVVAGALGLARLGRAYAALKRVQRRARP